MGSVTNLTDASGATVHSYTYEAFGNILKESGTTANTYQFQTKQASSSTGLVFFGARYYNPLLGRWLTPDPLGMIDGPNVYVYLNNNPVNLIDPWGMCEKNNWAYGLLLDWFNRIFEGTRIGYGKGIKGELKIGPIKAEVGGHAVFGKCITSNGLTDFYDDSMGTSLQFRQWELSVKYANGETKIGYGYNMGAFAADDNFSVEAGATVPVTFSGEAWHLKLQINVKEYFDILDRYD